MNKYLLDTNICIYLIKKKPKKILERLKTIHIFTVGISSITLSELEYGVEKNQQPNKNRLALIEFITPFEIYNFNDVAAKKYGEIRAVLEKKGKVIGPYDMLIAAHAKALNQILVTNNEREFNRISGLKVENWVKY